MGLVSVPLEPSWSTENVKPLVKPMKFTIVQPPSANVRLGTLISMAHVEYVQMIRFMMRTSLPVYVRSSSTLPKEISASVYPLMSILQAHASTNAPQATQSHQAHVSPRKTAQLIKFSKTVSANVPTTLTSSMAHAQPALRQHTTTSHPKHVSTAWHFVRPASTSVPVHNAKKIIFTTQP